MAVKENCSMISGAMHNPEYLLKSEECKRGFFRNGIRADEPDEALDTEKGRSCEGTAAKEKTQDI